MDRDSRSHLWTLAEVEAADNVAGLRFELSTFDDMFYAYDTATGNMVQAPGMAPKVTLLAEQPPTITMPLMPMLKVEPEHTSPPMSYDSGVLRELAMLMDRSRDLLPQPTEVVLEGTLEVRHSDGMLLGTVSTWAGQGWRFTPAMAHENEL